jgi:thioesterase domain-containing protein
MTDQIEEKKVLCDQLQSIWHEQIPLSKAMQMQIETFDGELLETRAVLEPNVNVHGTAFAGSLYAIQALTGWGMMHLQLKLNNLDASIVIASGQINYAKPVAEEIVVQCSFGEHAAEMEKLKTSGKGRFPLTCQVLLADGKAAGEFSGIYAVRLNR